MYRLNYIWRKGNSRFWRENEISRFSCHFLFEKVCLGVKKCISKLGILLPFHRCTEMFRWVNLSAKKVTYKIENQGGKCHVFANPRANNPSHTPVSIIFWDENVVLITNIAFIYLRYLPFEIYITSRLRLRPDCQRFHILAASPRRAAGLRPDCQRFYILAASPRSAAGLRPDFHRFYILATSPHHAAGLKTSEIKFLGGGFRCSSKIYS